MSLMLSIDEPAPASAPRGFALFALGFRPFYLLASLFGAASIALWGLQATGLLSHPYLAGPLWHAHEMLFGFALAVITGFLFTAGRNWSNQPTPTGAPLAALCALWLAARLLVLTPWGWAAALANVAFPLAVAAALGRALVKGGSRRNYFFVALLCAMAAAAAAFHLQQLGVLAFPARASLQPVLDLLLFILAVMAGRVLPMFTNNGVPGAGAVRHPIVERAALGSLLALLAAHLLGAPDALLAALAAAAASSHLCRWLLWRPLRALRNPLVAILHVAYAWVPVHLALAAMAAIGWVPPSLATHALTAGAAGGLVIGMMTRTARGHTGRPLRADRLDIACYVLVTVAALLRVGLPLAWPQATGPALLASAACWSLGFALYALGYAPSLLRPRADGRPG
ncbi:MULTISPECIES: NnrS family protein [Ramlibacter]|uniref:NnrS family protein n=1 Tax=Ramlibacter aquaticus TaxID=2780094 RepID=A0ABR9SG29_9BURK|nr:MULTISPECIES: NnrS family protein [Ramlibacter]MBE7941306.1 NnrS family protein [Ramlibacter aquaticus]